MKKAKAVRKTLADKLVEARAAGDSDGYWRGLRTGRAEFGPAAHLNSALNDFVRSIDAWPLHDEGVVFICGTDLKHGGSLSLPVRTVRAIAAELKRLGYSTRVV